MVQRHNLLISLDLQEISQLFLLVLGQLSDLVRSAAESFSNHIISLDITDSLGNNFLDLV